MADPSSATTAVGQLSREDVELLRLLAGGLGLV